MITIHPEQINMFSTKIAKQLRSSAPELHATILRSAGYVFHDGVANRQGSGWRAAKEGGGYQPVVTACVHAVTVAWGAPGYHATVAVKEL